MDNTPKLEVLTPDHLRWDTFLGCLEDMLAQSGCDGDESRGHSDHVHRHSKAILASMGFDIPATLAFFESHGGHCDCEVAMNVDPQ